MPRLTLCAVVDAPGERELLQNWLEKWRSKLFFVSENQGCGCCVDLYEVDGPAAALAELPAKIRAGDGRQNKHDV